MLPSVIMNPVTFADLREPKKETWSAFCGVMLGAKMGLLVRIRFG